MENFKEYSCRLCLKAIDNANYEIIDELTKDIFSVLFLKLKNIDEKNTNVICNVCSRKVFTAFEFKSACLCTDDIIFPYLMDGVPVTMNEIYLKEKESKDLLSMPDDMKICRLCMHVVVGDIKLCKDVDEFQVQKYMPEVDLNAIRDPVICKPCFDSLKDHSGFIMTCLNTLSLGVSNKSEKGKKKSGGKQESKYDKNKVESVANEEETAEDSVEFEKIIIKVEKNEERHQSPQTKKPTKKTKTKRPAKKASIKKREEGPLLKCNLCSYKSTIRKLIRTHKLTHRDPSNPKLFKCTVCGYATRHINHFRNHTVQHKEPWEIEWFHCELCPFKAKYKSHVKRHKLAKHADRSQNAGKRLNCDRCGYETSHKHCMVRHKLTHKSKEQLFECDFCDMKVRHKAHLTRHVQVAHSEKDVHKCESCDYQSYRKEALRRHLAKHGDYENCKRYVCDVCKFVTNRKYSLKRHIVQNHKNK